MRQLEKVIKMWNEGVDEGLEDAILQFYHVIRGQNKFDEFLKYQIKRDVETTTSDQARTFAARL